jgi:nucleotide-binding universal stress UspA family protein
MYRLILVPLDGSEFGERALPAAVALAQATKATLILLRAAGATATPDEEPAAAQSKAVADAETYLADVARRLAAQGIVAETSAPYAEAAQGILAEAAKREADLIVMCTHGRSGLGRWVYGSVAGDVLARSPVPVLLVRPTGPLAHFSVGAAPKVLLPLDGSAFSEAALPHAVLLTRALAGKLVILRGVVPSLGYYPDPVLGQPYVNDIGERILREEEDAARQYVTDVAQRLTADGLTVQTLVRVGFPSDTILDEAKASGAEIIVMATHGRTGLRELLLGSVALDVVRRGGLPLLLVRPGEPGASDAGARGSEQW